MWRSPVSLVLGGIAVSGAAALGAAAFVARRAAALYDAPETESDATLTSVSLSVGAAELPGWIVRPAAADEGRWALFLPGLGSHPLRHQAVASAFTDRGYTCLFASHSARRPARRHTFGAHERREALAWIRYAADHGAREVVLLGWSFGASLWLHALSVRLPVDVRAIVLTGPLVDWSDTIAHGARGGVLGTALAAAVRGVLATPFLCRLAGQRRPRSLRPASTPAGAPPLVVVHSDTDDTVPLATSRRLVTEWPAPASLHVVRGARHGAERDVDPTGWLDVVTPTV